MKRISVSSRRVASVTRHPEWIVAAPGFSGAVAQPGERNTGSVEVRGSSPLGSTTIRATRSTRVVPRKRIKPFVPEQG